MLKMKTTVELPDDLYRQVKAEAALRGRKFRDMVEEGLRHVLTTPKVATPKKPSRHPSPSVADLMRDVFGSIDGPPDLSTNPKYMEDFGRDASDR
jgi:hypothetical protein